MKQPGLMGYNPDEKGGRTVSPPPIFDSVPLQEFVQIL